MSSPQCVRSLWSLRSESESESQWSGVISRISVLLTVFEDRCRPMAGFVVVVDQVEPLLVLVTGALFILFLTGSDPTQQPGVIAELTPVSTRDHLLPGCRCILTSDSGVESLITITTFLI